MKKRAKVTSAHAKARRPKAAKLNHRSAPKAPPRFQSLPPSAEVTQVARLARDLSEAREQQAATSKALQVIRNSTFDLPTVFNTLIEAAKRLCEADAATIWRPDNERLALAASFGLPKEFEEFARQNPVSPGRGTSLGRVLLEGKTVHIPDVLADPEHAGGDYQSRGGYRSNLAVPLLRDGETIGAFAVTRSKARPFSDDQIKLLTTFSDQAVIAIENARLLNELRESLQQQTATADVLKVISRSTFDLQTVLNTLVLSATSLCVADMSAIYQRDGEFLRLWATTGVTPEAAQYGAEHPLQVGRNSASGRAALEGEAVHILDVLADAEYGATSLRDAAGYRTVLGVPLLRAGTVIGVFALTRREVSPFSEKQIELVTTFADQAVIAIENARLLNELRQSLEEQTATSDVLRVISSSPGELEPVFAAILASATRICEAEFGNLFLREEDAFRAVAWHGEPTYVNTWRGPALTIKTDVADIPLARLAATKQRVHVADLRQEAAYKAGHEHLVALIDKGGARTILIVPMLKEHTLVGAIAIHRQEVRPFADKQIELLENFAAQAVIAIENTRLLRELRERTEEIEKLNKHLEQRVTDQVDEIERMGRLRRFLPPQVADLIVASGTEKQLESHRREITALFCDLRGFTGFTESADAEDVMALLRDYHAAIGELIIKYSGTLKRYAGDGVMVVFNDPVPVEKPALQAVLMALETRDAIGALTEKWGRLGHDIGFGIGIAHGFATLGTIGFEGRFDYAAIGTVSNVASRLCDEAKPGQILISPRVLTKVENAVTVEPVGEFELKGIRRPLAAYNVVSANALS
jgi:GAF domain-containing protein